jgi:filamentous hemagglutinin family protein
MNTVVKTKFAVKPVVAAVALAVSAGGALADPTANALPGGGKVIGVNLNTTFSAVNYTVSGTGGLGATILNATANVATISINNPCIGCNVYGVIQWGGNAGVVDATNSNGFNIGRNAKLTFTDNALLNSVAILNIDASRNASQIFGQLEVAKGVGTAVHTLWVANQNGIIVGPNAMISAPDGVALVGANLEGTVAVNDFIANNSTATSFLDYTSGLSNTIEIRGGSQIAGSLVSNTPAKYVLLAGGNIVNDGNVFSGNLLSGVGFFAYAGMIAAPGKATVNAIANTVVNRLWDVTNSVFTVGNGNLGTAAPAMAIGDPTSTFVNTGAITAQGPVTTQTIILAAGGIRNGTLGDPALTKGIFTDAANVFMSTYTTAAKTEIYNVLTGYTTNPVVSSLNINVYKGNTGDVIINANTPASQASSITTTGAVTILGNNITIASSVNDKLPSGGGVQGDTNLTVIAQKNLTVSGNVGAGGDVYLTSNGPMVISGNVLSDTNKGGNGGIYITNLGTVGPNTTTISGNLSTASTSTDPIEIYHYGSATGKLTITGTITTNNDTDVFIYSRGNLDFGGVINASGNAWLAAYGSSVLLRGPINTDKAADGFAAFALASPYAQTKMYPAAVVTSPTVLLGYDGTFASVFGGTWTGVENVIGVNASGNAYLTAAEKPAAQFVTDNVVALLLGNLNGPIAGNTNWLKNQMQFAPLTPNMPQSWSLSAVGGHFQAVNIGVTGDANFDSGITITPFFTIGLSSGALGGGIPIGNGGSQLILNTSGDLGLVSNSGAQGTFGGPGFVGGGGNPFFQFPGGAAIKSSTSVTQFLPFYNAWTTVAQAYQGVFFESPVLNLFSYVATNGNSWLNLSSTPTNGIPTVYQIQPILLAPNPVPIGFGFVINPLAPHYNTYSSVIVGGPVNNCPIGLTC